MGSRTRIANRDLRRKVMSAEAAAALIPVGSNVGMSGFTGAGYPKAVPLALARRIAEANAAGSGFRVSVWPGRPPPRSSTARSPRPTGSSCGCPTSPIR